MHDVTTPRTRPPRVRPSIARHPVTAFLLPVFLVGWPVLALLALMARLHRHIERGDGLLLGQPVDHWLGLTLVMLFLVPTAVGVTRAAEGPHGVRVLLRRCVQWRGAVGWTVASALALPVIALALALLAGGRFRAGAGLPAVGAYAWSVLARTLLINLWEELAWSGFVQTRLRERHGVLAAALLTAVPFAAIHLPLQLLEGEPLLPAFVGLLLLSAVFRTMLGVVLAGTGGSVLAAGVLHAAFNSTANREGVIHAVVAGVDASLYALAAALVVTIVVTIALALRLRRRAH